MLALSTQAKEATKTGLAMAIVYGIAMSQGWMNPYWSAFAVAMISLPSAGQSLFKGALRMGGTMLGCFAALVILALAPQDRWHFMMLASSWIFFVTYNMIGSRRAYFWHVAGFVCLIVMLVGPSSPENLFTRAVARAGETAMGILVYTLITIFIWPRSNTGAVKKAGRDLLATQMQLLDFSRGRLCGQNKDESALPLRMQQTAQLTQLNQALQSEGAESYEVHEMRRQWAHFAKLSSELMRSIDRWYLSTQALLQVDVESVLANLQPIIREMDRRLEDVRLMLDGQESGHPLQATTLEVDSTGLRGLSHSDRAAVSLAGKELANIERLTRSLFDNVQELAGFAKLSAPSAATTDSSESRGAVGLPVPDVDRLQGAVFAATNVAVGFLIWILLDPPGHASMFQFPATIAIAVAGMPQMKATAFIRPFAVAMLLGLGVYVLVLPRLSGYAELGTLLFLFTFVTCYYFKGLGRLAGLVAMINMLSIQNEQTYDFAAMANSYIFTLMAFMLVFILSYMIGSPRPEKVLLHMVRRFFCSAEFLVSNLARSGGKSESVIARWRTAYHLQELDKLPQKLAAWGRTIDRTKFPKNTTEQTQGIVIRLQAFKYRIEELFDASRIHQSDIVARAMRDDVRQWREKMGITLGSWSREPGIKAHADLDRMLIDRLTELDQRIDQLLDQSGTNKFSEQDGQNFYHLLGNYRGLSEAVIDYAGFAGQVDWAHWREERF
ncbi:MAG: FUSC family protein [Planctomycetota bacterium]|jgi:uncharacterized membrane protein YccC